MNPFTPSYPFFTLSSDLRPGPRCLFRLLLPIKTLYAFLVSPAYAACFVSRILLHLIILKLFCKVLFFTPLWLSSFCFQILFLQPCYQMPSVCCLILMWGTKVPGCISGFLCGGWKEEILSIWFRCFGSQIFYLANISKNLLGVLSSDFSCLLVTGCEAVFNAACYVRAYRHTLHTHMETHIGVLF